MAGVLAVLVAAAVVAVVKLPKGLPPGIVLQGLVLGGLSSFTAMALVLVYRAARIVNFATAGIGTLGGAFAFVAGAGWGLPYVVAVLIGLAVAVAVGWAVDATVIRRLGRAPRLILTVATIGVFELLGAAQFATSHLSGSFASPQNYHSPLTGSGSWAIQFTVYPLIFTGDTAVAMVAVPLVLAGLWWFLARTEHGTAIRAVADSPERAVLLGIPARRVSRVVWMVAAGLSGLGAILTMPILQTQLAGSPPTPIDLLPALAAFALAGFESLPEAVGWSLVIGVLQQAVFWSFASSTYSDVALFVLVLVGLAFRRQRHGRVDDQGLGDYVAVGEVRPVPTALARLPEVRITKIALLVVLLAAAALVPLAMAPSSVVLVTFIVIFAIVAVSLVVVTGWSGQISLGQFGFAGIGALVTGTMIVHADADLFAALLVTAAVTAVVAAGVGALAVRLPGLAMGVVTLAFAVVVSEWLLSGTNFPFFNPTSVGRPELFGRFSLTSHRSYYELCLAFLVLTLLVARNLRRSRAGRAVIAVRDNRRGAAAFGIRSARTKLFAFAVSGAIAGVAGGLYVVALGGLGFGGIDPLESVNAFVMVVIGGLGSMTGAVLGAAFVQSTSYFLSGGATLVALGLGLLVPLMIFPQGLGGVVYQLRDALLRRVAARRHISLDVAADAGEPAPAVDPGRDTTDEVPAPVAAEPTPETAPAPLVAGPALTAALATAESIASMAAALHPAQPEPVPVDPAATGNEVGSIPLLAVEDADVHIGQVRILAGVSFTVARGEVLALLGTNGAGKSTTLRAIAGVLPTRRGRILFDGRDISRLDPEDRVRAGIAVVSGGRGVFPSLTVDENLAMAGWVARRGAGSGRTGLVESRAFVHDLFPRLHERRPVRAGLLSGGEQQMLAIAQALLCSPRLLMIDELSLGLAPTVVAELLDVIRRLADTGVAVVVVEQSFNVATALARRAVFLERGRVIFTGATAELHERPDLLRSVFLGSHDELPPPAEDAAAAAPSAPPVPVAGSPAFAVHGVSKHFGGVAALTDVDLHVGPGEILGVIGSNGAGKTTLFDVCSGFLTPDIGRVVLGGHDVTDAPAASRAWAGLGRVFQDARLFPSLTVAETVAAALECSVPVADPFLAMWWTHSVKSSEAELARRVDELLDEQGLAQVRDRFVSELSTGTRRIVELACIVGHRPSVLLLDEPSSGLAQRESEALGPQLLGLRDRTGAAFVIIEHDVPLVRSIADRLICLHLGEVIAEGTPAEVLSHPAVLSSYLGEDDVAISRSGAVGAR